MEKNDLPALRAGLNLFANTRNEVARRAKVSPTYVTEVLKGNYKNEDNKTVKRILKKAWELFWELIEQTEEIKAQLAVAS